MSNEWSKEWPKPIVEQTGITKELLGVKPWPEAWLSDKDIANIKTFHDDALKSVTIENGVFTDAALYGQGFSKDGKHAPLSDVIIGIDTATKPDRITAIIGHIKDGVLMIDQHLEGDEARAVIEAYNNKVPTHDPYTNPDMHIYHECACGAILDPNTKSFATLNTAASNVGWKIRWGVHTYKAYCFECEKDVE